jgi:hypothetical protein
VLAIEEVEESSQPNTRIEMRDDQGYKGVFAEEFITKYSVIFHLKGTISNQPTKYTIQVGPTEHLNIPADSKVDDDLDYSWQYLNHSCAPNGYVNTRERTFHALRNILPGEEITFNYLTTESEMAAPFLCRCGSENCFGFIAGRRLLTKAQARRLARLVGEDNIVKLSLPVT